MNVDIKILNKILGIKIQLDIKRCDTPMPSKVTFRVANLIQYLKIY